MKQELFQVKEPKHYDFILLAILGLMAITSIVAIYSAFELITSENPTMLLMKQIMWYILGFIVMSLIMYLGNDIIYSYAKKAYWFMLAALVYLFISKYIVSRFFGYEHNLPFVTPINGATSWFQFPGIGSFQPSEFMKVILIMITAGVIDEHNAAKVIDTYESDIQLFLKVIRWAFPPLLLILVQPDTGICIIIFISLTVMLMCSGIKNMWIITGAGIVILMLAGFFYLYFYNNALLISLFGENSLYKLDRISKIVLIK